MSLSAAARIRTHFYYGWWIVFASAGIVFLCAGTFFYGFGLLVTPLTQEFGWSRAEISIAFSLRTEVGGVAALAIGFALDRFGVRKLAIAGVLTVSLGFILFSRIESLGALYGSVIVIAMGMSVTGGAFGSVIISRWFNRRRGRALGFMTLGGGAGGVMAILFAWLITSFGWRESLVIVAVAQVLLAVPLALSIRERPSDMGLTVEGVSDDPDDSATSDADGAMGFRADDLTVRQALRSSRFWRIAIGIGLLNFATTALVVHQVPFLVESVGTSESLAAATVTVMTAMSLVGRLGFGAIADVVSKTLVMAAAMLCVAASLALLATVHHVWQLVYVLPLFGLGFGGAIPVRSTLQAEHFGLRAFGAIQGFVLTVGTVGGFLGPVLAGWLYDETGSYRLAFVLLAIGPLVAAPLVASIRLPARTAQS